MALITGASRGIGAASARALLAGGARVFVAARSEPESGWIDHPGARFISTDVADEEQVAALMEQILLDAGCLDWAVNCAGYEGEIHRAHDYPDEDCRKVFEVNVMGAFLAMKHEIRAMLPRESGAIVNLSSIAGVKGVPMAAPYAASKHAVIGLTRSVALEVVGDGIRVNAVCPSLVNTSMAHRLADKVGVAQAELVATNPMQRAADPEEVVAAVLWLLSEQASFVNGQAVGVDGGQSVA